MNIKIEKDMDKTLLYLAKVINKSGHNEKPVLLHSFKVGMILYKYNYSKTIIISGILHDILEDTSLTYDKLKEEYGLEIASIVEAVSFKKDIKDYLKRQKELFGRCILQGFPATVVKCADLIDNIDYVGFAPIEKQKVLIKKYKMFLDMSKTVIGEEKIYEILEQKYQKIINL